MNPYFTDYSQYLARKFGSGKVQKLSVNAALSCPNRDGTIGRGGCIYCDNASFTPSYCLASDSIASQIRKGKEFFARKYPEMRYLAYFQSFTGTNASVGILREMYEEALGQEGVVGLVVGTRPDCLPPEVITLLEDMNRRIPLIVELGVESLRDDTLRLIRRGHDSNAVERAMRNLGGRKIDFGAHLIAGLPGESSADVLCSIRKCVEWGASTLKLHQLQILRGTPLWRMWKNGEVEVTPWELEEYLDFCVEVVNALPKTVAIERFTSQAPPQMVETPKWGIKNHEFTNLLLNKLKNRPYNPTEKEIIRK